ncbi:SusC/RagA family TonB-linked outer membrane protein [Proteiniphilum sp. UBA5384]|uniref:SusC/RagA family TonB-linked outer membrane protein n=1 Tax=Proteiniphilum sp. UBA5384 TaxID=1947279 RepID=UPI0025FA8B1D|nr:TonB-dependent receptor [Proteiniphilum sp. UBA5384]
MPEGRMQFENSEVVLSTADKLITGVVYDADENPIPGVTVLVKGTTVGTITDVDGLFRLMVPQGDQIIQFSFIGYITQEIQINQKTDFKITLLEAITEIEEIVIVGYGTQKKETLVGSVTQVNSDKVKERGVVSNMTDALSGSMPGVTVMTSTGIPGGDSHTGWGSASSIQIRGATTWNNSAPLILVDGMERGMNDIDINEIESFSVLKDASATAVFGVKGANGVILITTKRGQLGKAKITFESNVSAKTISSLKGPVDSYQSLLARNYAIVSELAVGGDLIWNAFYIPERELNYYRDKVDTEKYPDLDWFDFMTRDYGISTKSNISASGGTEFVKYFASVGYINDGDILNTANPNAKGVTPEYTYRRFNFRSNLDFSITKTTQLGVNLSGYFGKQQTANGNFPKTMSGLMTSSPNMPLPIYSDGTYGGGDAKYNTNPYMDLMTMGTNVYNRYAFNSDFQLRQKLDFLLKGLEFKGRFSFDNYFNTRGREIGDEMGSYTTKYYDRLTDQWVYTIPGTTTGFEPMPSPLTYSLETVESDVLRNIYYEFGFTFDRTFDSHRIGALMLMSRENFVTGDDWPSKREDWVSRVTYDYQGKYLFEFNGAYNGSAKFGPKSRFDFFPSVAVGWRISEEQFVKKLTSLLSNLKLKYSIGFVGNDSFSGLGMWPYLSSFVNNPDNLSRFGNSALVNTPYNIAFREGTVGNPDLKWETARKQNIGIEFGFLDGTISGNVDYFDEYRYDMLIAANQRSVPDYYGAIPSAVNSGKVKSRGLELEMRVQKRLREVNAWFSAYWTKAVNKIIFREDPELKPNYQKQAGYTIGQNRTYVIDEIIQSWDNMYTGTLYESGFNNNATLIPGDYRMVDYNADGIINSQDVVPYQYSNSPQNTYGFSFGGDYKGFGINILFYGAYNASLQMNDLSRLEFLDSKVVVYPEQIANTFTPEYGNSNPSYRALNFNRNTQRGTFMGNSFMYDASFLRLKTAELSYTFPKEWISKLNMDNCRLYINGNNLFLWSNLPYDVEGVTLDYRNYPTTKLYNIGFQVTF